MESEKPNSNPIFNGLNKLFEGIFPLFIAQIYPSSRKQKTPLEANIHPSGYEAHVVSSILNWLETKGHRIKQLLHFLYSPDSILNYFFELQINHSQSAHRFPG